MGVQTQKAAFPLDAAPRSLAHGRRGARRSKHFTQFLTCRTTPQKLQASTHSGNKSAYPSWFRKHPQLHLAAEMARSPAAPGLLFTTAAVHGFTIVSEVGFRLHTSVCCLSRPSCKLSTAYRLSAILLIRGQSKLRPSVQASAILSTRGQSELRHSVQASTDSCSRRQIALPLRQRCHSTPSRYGNQTDLEFHQPI